MHTATTEIYTLSLHDALPIYPPSDAPLNGVGIIEREIHAGMIAQEQQDFFETVFRTGLLRAFARRDERLRRLTQDRKSTRLNSSHTVISYAVFCLKKKKKKTK